MCGMGGLTGPPIVGTAIDKFGANAVPVVRASFYLILLLGFALGGGRLIRELQLG